MLRFQDCTSALTKFGFVNAGARFLTTGPGVKDAPREVIGVIAPTLIGSASGGLAVRPVTKPVIGWSTWNAYPPRRMVLPLWNRSQANPTRGWKLVLFCWYGSVT